ncbi:MAG: endonuclease/exonuclease/phosphatase family protein [Planctomycetota bacterium]
MKIFAWNILHGGGKRLPWIALELLDARADVVCLTEFRPGLGGGQLRGVLADHGYAHQHATDPGPRRNGVLIASRSALCAPREHNAKLVTVELPEAKISLTVAHLPDAKRGDVRAETKKSAAWHAVLDEARGRTCADHAVVGDFNTGRHRIDEAGETFTCTALMGQLRTLGYRDAWSDVGQYIEAETTTYTGVGVAARRRPTATWVSHAGTGFRLDHAWCSGSLARRVRTARYLHEPRQRRLSDHSAMVVELADP